MKISKYNLIFDYKNEKLAFNSMTCALVTVNSDFLEILKEIENNAFDKTKYSKKILDLVKDMKKGGFIVGDCFDELEFLKFKNYQGKFQTNNFRKSLMFYRYAWVDVLQFRIKFPAKIVNIP